jgi:hypothetical protein
MNFSRVLILTREELKHKKIDIIAKIRRTEQLESVTKNLGIILNDDGSVFDKKIKKQYNNIIDWSKEVVNV